LLFPDFIFAHLTAVHVNLHLHEQMNNCLNNGNYTTTAQ